MLLEDYRKAIGELSVSGEVKYCEVTDKDYQKALERIDELEKYKEDMERTKKLMEELLSNEEVLKELNKDKGS